LALDDPLASRLPEGWSVPAFVGPAAGEPSPGAPSGAGGSTGSGGPTGAAQAEPIRLWHLATHTSGLPRLPPGILSADPADPYAAFAAADLQAALAGLSLRRAPGSAYAYSNLGAGLLGFCLAGDAAALDRRFGERLFGPLGMGDTRIRLEEAQLRRLAQPHGEGGRAGSRWGFEALAGAGALHSSVDDLLRFAAIELGLASADPSSPGAAEGLPATLKATLESACRERWRSPKGDLAMGLGWHLEPESGVRWHNGQTGGYHSYLAIDPARSHGVVVLANAGAGQADALGARLRALLAGEAVPGLGLRAPVALEPAALEPLVGEYSAGFLQRRRVFREGPRLFLAETGAEPVRLYPLSPTRFFAGGDEREFEFEFEGDAGSGPASALVALRGERRERAKRIVPKPAETE
jgi:CubicO group peptidase (beta-lactamase class C family)